MVEEHKYIIARWCYGIGEPIISDAEYTMLHKLMLSRGHLPEYTSRAWSSDPCPYEILKQYGMEDKAAHILLTDKTESIPTIGSELELAAEYGHLDHDSVLSFKLDGWSITVTYYNGQRVAIRSRGRSSDVLDVENIGANIPYNIPEMGLVEVNGEAVMTVPNFEKLKALRPGKALESRRHSIRSALTDPEGGRLVDLVCFDIKGSSEPYTAILQKLNNWGFKTVKNIQVKSYGDLREAMKVLDSQREEYPYLTDGMVIRATNGTTKHAIRLLGWTEGIYKSYVTGYIEEPSALYYNMRCQIAPVRLEGSKQSVVSVTNLDTVCRNNLVVGSPIAFKMRSHAYPTFDEDSTRIIQETWRGRYDAYRDMIDEEEGLKSKWLGY